jgi:hypothetical protein
MFPTDGTGEEITRNDCLLEVVKERIGFNSSCLCVDCMTRFEADLRDEWWHAGSRYAAQSNVKTVFEHDRRTLPPL